MNGEGRLVIVFGELDVSLVSEFIRYSLLQGFFFIGECFAYMLIQLCE